MSANATPPGPQLLLEDIATEAPLLRLSATLNRPRREAGADATVPPLWHWLYFTPDTPQDDLAEDGHPKPGGFLPETHLPRRMWAGGQLEFHAPIQVGQRLQRRSRVTSCEAKRGRSGEMVFIGVDHVLSSEGQILLRERQSIVYREASSMELALPEPQAASEVCDMQRSLVPDSRLLFRFSALTFNTHRIHYDRAYAINAEGYPGLVVHGPLVATLLMDLLHQAWPQARVRSFRFRALAPLFDGRQLTLRVRRVDVSAIQLWASNDANGLAMEASADVSL